jgi:hypothetical protein
VPILGETVDAAARTAVKNAPKFTFGKGNRPLPGISNRCVPFGTSYSITPDGGSKFGREIPPDIHKYSNLDLLFSIEAYASIPETLAHPI